MIDQFLHDMSMQAPVGFREAYATELLDRLGPAVGDWHHPASAEQPGPGKLSCT